MLEFQSEFERIRTNYNVEKSKREEQIANELGPVTSFYKQTFVVVEKFNEGLARINMENEKQRNTNT
jgi:hypothetical protein